MKKKTIRIEGFAVTIHHTSGGVAWNLGEDGPGDIVKSYSRAIYEATHTIRDQINAAYDREASLDTFERGMLEA